MLPLKIRLMVLVALLAVVCSTPRSGLTEAQMTHRR